MINLRNTREYVENFLKIRTKDQRLILLKFNQPQDRYYAVVKQEFEAGRPLRFIILKARQMGFSTLTEAVMYKGSATKKLTNTMIVAHTEDATTNLHNMNKLFYEESPREIRPMRRASNAKEIIFENPARDPDEKKRRPGLRSRIRCATAGGKGIGRSFTVTNLHLSEYAFWPGKKIETMTGLLQMVPASPGTMIVIESTANGFDDFKKRWDDAVSGESDYVPLFFPWHEMDEYRMKAPSGTKWTKAERELKKQFKLDDEQLAWRRWCIKNNCNGDERIFHQEYPSTPDEAFIYSGTGVFDNVIIVARREAIKDLPCRRGIFEYDTRFDAGDKVVRLEKIRFVEREDGPVWIYREPEERHPYVAGGDTAGEGSDWFAAHMIDNSDGALSAVIHHQFDEDLYAHQLYCLGRYYNDALLGPETNFSTYPIKTLRNLRYPNLYVREREDTFTGKIKKSYGFQTNSLTRPVIIADLVRIMRDTPEACCDYATLGEMLTFVRNEDGRPEAMENEHDDLLMSLAITYYIRHQQRFEIEPAPGEKKEWTKDMWDDFNRATPEVREYLMAKWGQPK